MENTNLDFDLKSTIEANPLFFSEDKQAIESKNIQVAEYGDNYSVSSPPPCTDKNLIENSYISFATPQASYPWSNLNANFTPKESKISNSANSTPQLYNSNASTPAESQSTVNSSTPAYPYYNSFNYLYPNHYNQAYFSNYYGYSPFMGRDKDIYQNPTILPQNSYNFYNDKVFLNNSTGSTNTNSSYSISSSANTSPIQHKPDYGNSKDIDSSISNYNENRNFSLPVEPDSAHISPDSMALEGTYLF